MTNTEYIPSYTLNLTMGEFLAYLATVDASAVAEHAFVFIDLMAPDLVDIFIEGLVESFGYPAEMSRAA